MLLPVEGYPLSCWGRHSDHDYSWCPSWQNSILRWLLQRFPLHLSSCLSYVFTCLHQGERSLCWSCPLVYLRLRCMLAHQQSADFLPTTSSSCRSYIPWSWWLLQSGLYTINHMVILPLHSSLHMLVGSPLVTLQPGWIPWVSIWKPMCHPVCML